MVDDGLGPEDAPAANDPALAIAARHALHDEESVVAFATGSFDPLDEAAEIERAKSLVDRCAACRELHRDIAAIGSALRMDARGAATAPRDFRLTAEDARRLGGPALDGGFIAAFRRSIVAFARPVGASLAALGITGILVGSAALSGAGFVFAPMNSDTGAPAASFAPAEAQGGVRETGAPKSTQVPGAFGPEATADGRLAGNEVSWDRAAMNPDPALLLMTGSVALLVLGLAFLVIAFRRGRGSGAKPRNS